MAFPACIDDAAHHGSAAGHVQRRGSEAAAAAAATAGRPGWSACPAVVDLLPRRAALAVLREHLLGLGDPVRHRVDVTPCLVDRVVQAVEIPAPLREALPRSLQVLARGTNGLVVPAILRHPANLGCRTCELETSARLRLRRRLSAPTTRARRLRRRAVRGRRRRRPADPGYRVCGNPRSTFEVAGSGQREVTTFERV